MNLKLCSSSYLLPTRFRRAFLLEGLLLLPFSINWCLRILLHPFLKKFTTKFVLLTKTLLITRLIYPQLPHPPVRRIWSAWWKSEPSFSDGEIINGKSVVSEMAKSWETVLRNAVASSCVKRRPWSPLLTSLVSILSSSTDVKVKEYGWVDSLLTTILFLCLYGL